MKKQFLATLALVTLFACQSKPPPSLGLNGKSLSACPESPNCVSSMISQKNKDQYISPIKYKGKRSDAQAKLIATLLSEGGVKLEFLESDGYYRYVFRTKIMGFQDDLEFYFPSDQQLIHVRSASRTGYSDFGVNRKRIEMIRSQLNASGF